MRDLSKKLSGFWFDIKSYDADSRGDAYYAARPPYGSYLFGGYGATEADALRALANDLRAGIDEFTQALNALKEHGIE
jgi:hypothetical protein